MRHAAFFIVLTLLLLPDPGSGGVAMAEEDRPSRYAGRLTTVLEAYQNAFGNTATPVYEYLSLTVFDPYGIGDRSYFHFYGRLATDLSDEDDTESRLYSAYLDVQGAVGNLDMRLGRQFVATVAGSALMDGADIWYRGGRLDFRLYAGGNVTFEESYNEGDAVYGAGIELSGVKGVRAALSYYRKDEGWDKQREAVGMEAAWRVTQWAKLYGEASYDLFSESYDHWLAGARFMPSGRLTLNLLYNYDVPVFDAASIYSVFAVSEKNDLELRAHYRLSDNNSLFGLYRKEFEDVGDDSDVVEAGFMRRVSAYRVEASVMSISGDDSLVGGRLRGMYAFSDNLELGGGVEYDTYEYEYMTAEESASLYYAEAAYRIRRDLKLQARVEVMSSVVSDDNVRGIARLAYDFGN